MRIMHSSTNNPKCLNCYYIESRHSAHWDCSDKWDESNFATSGPIDAPEWITSGGTCAYSDDYGYRFIHSITANRNWTRA